MEGAGALLHLVNNTSQFSHFEICPLLFSSRPLNSILVRTVQHWSCYIEEADSSLSTT